MAGATVSTLMFKGALAGLVLPLLSLSVVVMAWSPSLKGVDGVKLHLPSAATAAEPMSVPLSYTLTTLPGEPLPLNVGVLSSVAPLGLITPFSKPKSSVALGVVGVVSVAVLLLKFSGSLAGLVLPAGSVSLVVIEWLPSGSGVVGVNVQLPLGPTVAVPMTLPLSRMLTVLPGVPLPLKVGVLSSVVLPGVI